MQVQYFCNFVCLYTHDQQLNQDFLLLFGVETVLKVVSHFSSILEAKVINEAKHLTQSVELCWLPKAAEKMTENDDTSKLIGMIGFYS